MNKKYKTVVIDPPWEVKFIELEMRPNQVEMPYETMTLDEIEKFPILNYADNDCNLFMWTTHTFLPASFDILEKWGFKYHCCLTWDKGNGRPLCGFKRDTEFCLYAHRGKITVNQRGNFIHTLFREKLREHSRKPDSFYEILRTNTPEPRIDIFARYRHFGFDSFGNEVQKEIQMPLELKQTNLINQMERS